MDGRVSDTDRNSPSHQTLVWIHPNFVVSCRGCAFCWPEREWQGRQAVVSLVGATVLPGAVRTARSVG